MSDFDSFLREQLDQEDVRREYYRLDPFYRLADQLILLRKRRGLTQKELADKAGTTQAVVSRLENAAVRASLDTVIRLADALDAVVDLKLKAFEEIQDEANEVPSMESPCAEERVGNVVYFDKARKAECQDAIWYAINPLTLNTHRISSRIQREKYELEYA